MADRALTSRLRESARELRDSGTTQDSLDWHEIRDRSVVRIAAELTEAADALEAGRKPDGYAYEYESPFGGIRFNNGEPVNGSKPTRAIPYWLGNAPAAKVAQEGAAGVSVIDTADHVLHGPTGETWVVARVNGKHLHPCGWPPTRADLSDCTLVKKATLAEREQLLRDLSQGQTEHAGWAAGALGVATNQPAGWHVSFDGGLTWEYHADDPWGRLGERVAIVRPLIYGDGADWRTAGVAPAAPMQGLAAYLRAQASALERSYLSPKDAPHDNIDTLRQWALEVDGAAGVREDGRG